MEVGGQTLTLYSTVSKDERSYEHRSPKTLPFRDIDTFCLHRKFTRIAVGREISSAVIISFARSESYVRASYVLH